MEQGAWGAGVYALTEDATPLRNADPRMPLPRSRKPCVAVGHSCPFFWPESIARPLNASPATGRQGVSGTGIGRFSMAAAITSGNRSGVQAKAGAPNAASAAACSRS